MRIRIYRASLVAVAVLVIIASTLAIYYTNQAASLPKQSIGRETEFMYYLKEHDKKIGVYRVDESAPFMTLDVYVDTLPYVDRVALSDGINVVDDDKLKILIEDYES